MSRKIIEYITVFESKINLLDKTVNLKINQGYELYGDPYTAIESPFNFSDNIIFFQAMVKYKKEDKAKLLKKQL